MAKDLSFFVTGDEQHVSLTNEQGYVDFSVVDGVTEITAIRTKSLERYVRRFKERITGPVLLRALLEAFQFVRGKDKARVPVKPPGTAGARRRPGRGHGHARAA